MNYYDLLIYRSTHQSLFVKDQSFTFTQLVVATYKIKWRGKNKPTFSTSDTLPTGFALSSDGIVSYDGSVIQSGVTNWTVTATDGVDTVTASMTMTLNEATVKIVDGQMLSFNIGVASQMQIRYAADGTPTFAVTSGTLPSGMTMTTGGLLEYDGTGSTKVSTSIEVTATLPTSASDTATVGVKLTSIPQDYVFYAPLETNETPETGTYITKATRWAFDTAPDGTQCAYNSDYSQGSFSMEAIQYTADIASTDSITLSIWGYCTRESGVTPPDWLCPISVGNKSGSGFTIEFGYSGNLEVPWVINATGNGLRPTNNEWHHFAMVYERGGYIKLYVDGTNTWTSADTKTINIGSGNVYIGGRYNDGRPWVGYLKDAKVYNRVLTDAEIVELATVSWS